MLDNFTTSKKGDYSRLPNSLLRGAPKRKKTTIKASKKGNAQFISTSDNLLNMLSRQPRTNNKIIFPKRGRNARRVSFSKRMKRLARLKGNNRYRKIHLHTFRHAFALRTYHRTKDILHVKMLMGHKSLLTTFGNKFLHSVVYDSEESNQFVTKVTATKEERCELINDGWEFIKNDGDDWYFRKPK